MSPFYAASFITFAIASILGCSQPDKSALALQANTTQSAISNVVLLNPIEFSFYSTPILEEIKDEFTKRELKELATHCWSYYDAQKCMVLFSKDGENGLNESADIGGFFTEYETKTQQWKITARSLTFTQNGTWGAAPTPHFVKLGPDKYGFLMVNTYSKQGYSYNVTTLYGVVGNSFVEMLSLPTGESNTLATDDPKQQYSVIVNLYQTIDNYKDFYDLKAELIADENYDYLKDEYYGKLFAKSKSVNLPFQNGIYATHSDF